MSPAGFWTVTAIAAVGLYSLLVLFLRAACKAARHGDDEIREQAIRAKEEHARQAAQARARRRRESADRRAEELAQEAEAFLAWSAWDEQEGRRS